MGRSEEVRRGRPHLLAEPRLRRAARARLLARRLQLLLPLRRRRAQRLRLLAQLALCGAARARLLARHLQYLLELR